MSAKELRKLPSLPPTTPVHSRKRRFGHGARMISDPLDGWIGWVEPKDIPGAAISGTGRVGYFWCAAKGVWLPVRPRTAFELEPASSYGLYPDDLGPGAD